MRENLTHVVEDYLKTIYNLTAASGRATTNQIAEQLGVTPASVTNMLQKLAVTQPSLVEYRKHRGVVLTEKGEQVALEIIRHHRLLEMFLHAESATALRPPPFTEGWNNAEGYELNMKFLHELMQPN